MNKSQSTNENSAWWKIPILGILIKRIFKPEVPRKWAIEHQKYMQEAQKIAGFAYQLDSEIFGKPEFILLVKTKQNLEQEKPGYEGLKLSAKLLETALEARECFRIIEQIEFQYYGKIQQEFYQKIFQLLSKDLSRPMLNQLLKRLTQSAFSRIKSEEGKKSIQAYSKQVEVLINQHELGLSLFLKFKNNNLQFFSVLEKISKLVKSFQTREVHYDEEFLMEVEMNNELFQYLGNVLNIPDDANSSDKYAKLLQYLVLKDKYQNADLQLNQLLNQLKKWYKPYQRITKIRKTYPKQDYKQPSDFQQTIPGFDVYQKYRKWLWQSILKESYQ